RAESGQVEPDAHVPHHDVLGNGDPTLQLDRRAQPGDGAGVHRAECGATAQIHDTLEQLDGPLERVVPGQDQGAVAELRQAAVAADRALDVDIPAAVEAECLEPGQVHRAESEGGPGVGREERQVGAKRDRNIELGRAGGGVVDQPVEQGDAVPARGLRVDDVVRVRDGDRPESGTGGEVVDAQERGRAGGEDDVVFRLRDRVAQ